MANKALSFDGTDDKVVVDDSASLSAISPLSIEAWIKAAPSVSGGIISKDDGTNREWLIRVIGDGRFGIFLYSAATANYLSARGTTDVADNSWHYIVVTWDGVNAVGHIKFWVDGSEETLTVDLKQGTGCVPHDSNAPVELGRYAANNTYCWGGLIDEARISDKVRSQAEIEAIWNSGSGQKFEVDGNTIALWHIDEDDGAIFDETANNNDGTIDGATWVDGFPFLLGWSGGDVNGVDIGTIAKINGIAIADIQKVNGVS